MAHVAPHLPFWWRAYVRSGLAHAVKLALCLDGLPVPVPPADLEGLRRNVAAILDGALAKP